MHARLAMCAPSTRLLPRRRLVRWDGTVRSVVWRPHLSARPAPAACGVDRLASRPLLATAARAIIARWQRLLRPPLTASLVTCAQLAHFARQGLQLRAHALQERISPALPPSLWQTARAAPPAKLAPPRACLQLRSRARQGTTALPALHRLQLTAQWATTVHLAPLRLCLAPPGRTKAPLGSHRALRAPPASTARQQPPCRWRARLATIARSARRL